MEVLYELIYNAVLYFFTNVIDSMINDVMFQISSLMKAALDILDNPLVQNGIKLSQAAAGSLLGVSLAVEGLRSYILYQHGEPGADTGRLFTRVILCIVVIAAIPWLPKFIYSLGNNLAMAVGSISSYEVEKGFNNITAMSAVGMPVMTLVMILAVLVLGFLILLQAAIRGVELGALSVVGPFMAIGLMRADEGVFAVWWRELVVLSMTQALQVLLIKGFLAQSINITSSGLGLFFAVAWLWVTFKTPSFLRQFAYHTGIGSAAGGMARMMLVRKMLTRGA